jgi:ubiquinone/menaquinone biosynthesis C-methylase UbiE
MMQVRGIAHGGRGKPHPLFRRVEQLVEGYRGAKALFAAVELGVFKALDETDGAAPAVAGKVGASPDRLEIVLNALVALGFLKKTRTGRFLNTRFSRERFTPDGAVPLVENLRYLEFLSGMYADFVDTVRRGRPRQALGDLLKGNPEFVRHYIQGMVEIGKGVSRELAEIIDASSARDMLDVGGGPGQFSLAFLERNPNLRSVVLDFPETLAFTRRYAAASPVGAGVFFRAGDYRKADFGRNCYDLILMSHITHDEGAEDNRSLVRKAYRALRPGGRLVIHDFMVNRERTAPLFPALFSLHVASYTESGRAYSEAEYAEWMRREGFSVSRPTALLPAMANSTKVIIGTKNRGTPSI